MNIESLKKLISEGESQHLEFKKSTTQIKAAFETACAFLNDKGGIILMGVKDNGEIIGQEVADQTKQALAHEFKKIEPHPPINIHYVTINNTKKVIVLEVKKGNHAPYTYDGRAYERNQSTTERMTQHHYEQLIIQRGQLNHSWETQLTLKYTINDLDHDEIREMVQDGIDQNRISPEVQTYTIDRILAKLELINEEKLTNAAVVLFAKKICSDFVQCTIKMARFRGNDKLGDFIDNQRVSGNAFQIIKAAHAFTDRHLPIASYFISGQIKRVDQPAVPNLALREALINSICHREYTETSSTLSLAIYDDRLELWNVGTLPKKIKLDDLRRSHDSFPRNPKIAMTFYKRGWIETWGTGTTRMINFCKNNGTPEPQFTEYSGGFAVTFPFKEPMHTAIDITTPALSSRQREIIEILKINEMSLKEIMQHLKNPPAERTLRDDLAYLKELKIVGSQGLSRATTWFLIK